MRKNNSNKVIAPSKTIIGVMGGASITEEDYDMAFELGARIAEKGWILLNGGRDAGIMRASAEGARSKNGLTIGILPGPSKASANPFIDIAIVTNLADARNLINVLTSDIVVACPGGAGTLSEIALALKNDKPVVLLKYPLQPAFHTAVRHGQLFYTDSPAHCIARIEKILTSLS